MSADVLALLALCFLIISFLYASVGFGGGSSYLALLALVVTNVAGVRTTALLCNLVVVSGSVYWYYRRGHLSIKEFLPFGLVSVPMAYLGASFRLSEQVFYVLLGATLIVSASLLLRRTLRPAKPSEPRAYPASLAWWVGGGIGLLAGLVGIGGGIFLAPLLHHLRWDTPVRIAALASFFILVNSTAGLVGFASAGSLRTDSVETPVLLAAVLLGGQLGIRLSLRRFSGRQIRLVTAVLVLVVGVRVLLVNGLGVV